MPILYHAFQGASCVAADILLYTEKKGIGKPLKLPLLVYLDVKNSGKWEWSRIDSLNKAENLKSNFFFWIIGIVMVIY